MKLIRNKLLYILIFIFVSCADDNEKVHQFYDHNRPITCEYRSQNYYRDLNPLTGKRIKPILNSHQQKFSPDTTYILKKKLTKNQKADRPKKIDIRKVQEEKLPSEFTGIDISKGAWSHFEATADTFKLDNDLVDTLDYDLDSVKKVSFEMEALKETPKLKQYDNAYFNIKSISQDHGLPSNDVYGIDSDSKGNYWVSTGQGIAWVNKNFIKIIKQLPASLTTSTLEDKNGNIWISLYEGGVVKYDGLNMYHFDQSYFLKDDKMHDLFEDSEGNIWVSRSRGASVISDSTIINFGIKRDFIKELRSISEDNQGNIWFASVAGGVSMFNGIEFLNWNKDNGFIYNDNFDIISGDEVWIGTHGAGLVRYKNGQFDHMEKGLKNKTLTGLYEDSKGLIWIGTDGGGVHYIKGNRVFNISTKSGLSDDIVLDISEDKRDNMLLGTYGGGVNIIRKPDVKNFYKENGLKTNKVSTLHRDRNGKLWIGSWGVGFGYIEDDTIHWFQDDENLAGYVLSFEEDEEGNLWIGTYSEGVIKYDGSNYYHYPPEQNVSNEIILDIDNDEEGRLWFSANSGLFRRENDRFTEFVDLEKVFLDKPMADIDCEVNGKVYIASESYGLKIIQNDTVYSITEFNGLPSNDVLSVESDNSGGLWIGTRKGLALLKDSVFYYFDEKIGLCNNVINDIEVKSDSSIWITTSDGLSNIRLEKNLYIIDNYDTDDGLKNDDFFAAPIVMNNNQNSFWLGSNKGLISFDIPQTKQRQEGSIEIRQIEVNGRVISKGAQSKMDTNLFKGVSYERFDHIPKSLTLNYDQNNLAFYYSVNGNFIDQKFQFRLIGFDDVWSKPIKENKVDFKNLPQGKYTFQVRAKGERGAFIIDEFDFIVHPPFWLTWYAKLIYLFMGLLGVLLIVRLRTYRLRRHQKFLEEEIREATNEIRNQKREVEIQRDFAEDQKVIVQRKNEEILDSINYSKRLQDAILPSIDAIKEEFRDAFVLFKPKDIVSGDFYWMEKLKGYTMLAVADCTGHGVPGAMVSVVCANALNKVVLEMGKTDPAQILDHTRDLVIETFSKSSEDVKDGMDISLCVFDNHKQILRWAGANNPLWIIRNSQDDIEVIKADKQPIGKYGLSKPFTAHTFHLGEGDLIYMFSDGFADQFGGDKGKKMKSSKFKQLLLTYHSEKMEVQTKALNNAFEEWKGNLEQIDDVCVVGVQIR